MEQKEKYMYYRIITIDPENSGVPEDGFGIRDNGDLFVAISKDGFSDDKQSLIFTFTDKGVSVECGKVFLSLECKLNDFNDVLAIVKNDAIKISENHNLKILNKVYEYYIKNNGQRSARKKKEFQSIIPIIGCILSKIYSAVGSYYDEDKVCLKKSKYTHFFQTVASYKSLEI